jgi:iron-sulfur cluster assembly accessory protein
MIGDSIATTPVDAPSGVTPVSLSEPAAARLRQIMAEQAIEGAALRVFVSGASCAGLQYGLGFESNIDVSDRVFESVGLQVVVDPVSFGYLEGAHVDYVDAGTGGGFKIDNPNAVLPCGRARSADAAGGCAGCG